MGWPLWLLGRAKSVWVWREKPPLGVGGGCALMAAR